MSDNRCFVIVGAGQAARWIALTLRADGFAGRIVWFGDEAHRPYDRPPLSKAVLKGEATLEQLALLAPERFDALNVEWHAGEAVTSIDRAARQVHTSRGGTQAYDVLFLATGGQARMLPGLQPHPRVCALRTWADAQALREQLGQARRVLVLGAGWIGLEVAASARALGCEVTVVEAAARVCIRTVPACVSEHLEALHRGHGVTLRLGAAVQSVQTSDTGVQLQLADGQAVQGELLVVGIGLVPNDALATAAGLATANGVLTDAQGRTEDPAIFAAGDVANALRKEGTRVRVESWENAQRQAVTVAKAALGLPHDPDAEGPGWFWSDQFQDNLQVLGEPLPTHRMVERSVPAKGQRLFFFCEGPVIKALAAVNAGREVKLVRKWMREGRFPRIEQLADTGTELSKLPLAVV